MFGCDLDEKASAETVGLVTTAGGTMAALAPVDLSGADGARAWVGAAVAEFGGVDILHNNASALRNGALMDLSDDDWHFAPPGGLSGWACHRFGPEPLVVTLGMSSVVVGALLGTDTTLVNGAGPGWLQSFTAQSSKTLGLPLAPIIAAWIVLAIVISVILAWTPLGRRLYLTGAGPRAAELAGISTGRVWTGVYAFPACPGPTRRPPTRSTASSTCAGLA